MGALRSGFAARCEAVTSEIFDAARPGFAARCEAGLRPAGNAKKINGAMPPVRALPSESSGSKTGGRSPNKFLVALPAGHSPASHQAAKPVRETTSDALDQPLRRHCANVSDQPVRETTSDALDQPLRRHCANV